MATRHYRAATFTSATSVGYLLKLAHLLMLESITTAFGGHDVSFVQWLTLMKLKEGRAATASDLCKSMHYDNGSVTRLLDQLEERGLLRRERSKSDRRVIMLKLTPAGDETVTELIPVVVDALNGALSEFSKAEFAQFVRLLDKLIATVRTRSAARTKDQVA